MPKNVRKCKKCLECWKILKDVKNHNKLNMLKIKYSRKYYKQEMLKDIKNV